MQEKIKRLITDNIIIDGCECDNVLEITADGAAAEITKLFERKEPQKKPALELQGSWCPPKPGLRRGILKILRDDANTVIVPNCPELGIKDTERVRVVVEEIDEKDQDA